MVLGLPINNLNISILLKMAIDVCVAACLRSEFYQAEGKTIITYICRTKLTLWNTA